MGAMDALALTPTSQTALLARASRVLAGAETLPAIATLIDQAEVVRVAARKARLGREAQNEWAVFKLDAARKAGRVLARMKASGDLASGRGGDRRSINATLIDHLGGTSPQAAWERADRWQRLAAWPDTEFRAWLATMRASEDAEITEAAALRSSDGGTDLAGLFMSDATGWLTPRRILDLALATLGAIDLDPCSNNHENPRVPAATHYTAADDGLTRPWHGRVFLNPPYGRTIGDWVDKLATEFHTGRVDEAIALVPARTDTAWWRALPARLICFASGRLSFSDHDTPAPFPSAVAYLGADPVAFVTNFSTLGPVYAPVATPSAPRDIAFKGQ